MTISFLFYRMIKSGLSYIKNLKTSNFGTQTSQDPKIMSIYLVSMMAMISMVNLYLPKKTHSLTFKLCKDSFQMAISVEMSLMRARDTHLRQLS